MNNITLIFALLISTLAYGQVVNISTVDSQCGVSGAIIIGVEGGTPPYAYYINGTASAEPTILVPAGSHEVTVHDDATGKIATLEVIIGCNCDVVTGEYSPEQGSISVTCEQRGSAFVYDATGYTYLWNNGETTPTIINLSAGTYGYVVTDPCGKVAATGEVTVGDMCLPCLEGVIFPTCNADNEVGLYIEGNCTEMSLVLGNVIYTQASGNHIPLDDAGTYTVIAVPTGTGIGYPIEVIVPPCPMVTSVDEVVDAGVNIGIYPNPATRYINVKVGDSAARLRYRIIDLAGRLLQSGSLEPRIEVGGLAPGAYIVQVLRKNGSILVGAKKIVIIK